MIVNASMTRSKVSQLTDLEVSTHLTHINSGQRVKRVTDGEEF